MHISNRAHSSMLSHHQNPQEVTNVIVISNLNICSKVIVFLSIYKHIVIKVYNSIKISKKKGWR